MEPLFETSTIYTYEEYKRFNNALIFKGHILVLSIIPVLLIFAGGVLLKSNVLVVFAIIYPILFIVAKNIGAKRVYNSNKIIQNAKITFKFYEDHFEQFHESGDSNIPYEKLNKIIETKTNFYLMIAKNQGYILTKENMPDGLEEFLKEIKQKGDNK